MDGRGNNAPLIAAGSGAVLFISLFIGWSEGLDDSLSAWKIFDVVDIVLAVLALIAVGIGAMLATGNPLNLPRTPGSIVTTVGIISFSIVAAFVLEGEELKFGIYLALLATVGIVVGGTQLAATGAPPARRTGGTEPPTTSPPPPPPPPPASPTV